MKAYFTFGASRSTPPPFLRWPTPRLALQLPLQAGVFLEQLLFDLAALPIQARPTTPGVQLGFVEVQLPGRGSNAHTLCQCQGFGLILW
jgi:hypothetical protein